MELNFSKIVTIELRPPYAELVRHKGDLCTCEKCRYLKTRHFGLLIGISNAFYAIKKKQVKSLILDNGIRPDNRNLTEIRPIWCETDVLPRAQ